MLHSTSLRLAVIYTGMFAIAVAGIGLLTVVSTHAALSKQFDAQVQNESVAVQADYAWGGERGVLHELQERKGNPGELSFGVQNAAKVPLSGPLAGLNAPLGWSFANLNIGGRMRRLRVLVAALPNGDVLLTGDDTKALAAVDKGMEEGFSLAFVAVIVVGVVGGLAYSRQVNTRLGSISGTAEAIMEGDLGRRIPIGDADDDLAQLAATINRMLDRIGALMESLRQVSSDVAHDLRTPLTRLKQKLELSIESARDSEQRTQMESALEDVDAILVTFAAVLRIAQVDAGARRSAFRPVDLGRIVRGVYDDYRPVAEDAGQSLTLSNAAGATIDGDEELLTQMVVNLVENALVHTPSGSRIDLGVREASEQIAFTVRDDGPGVPVHERERVFDRFYRLERSRTTPGSGLGLALVQAVVKLHRGAIQVADAGPGLEVHATFPR